MAVGKKQKEMARGACLFMQKNLLSSSSLTVSRMKPDKHKGKKREGPHAMA
jgi:hypothetical protein